MKTYFVWYSLFLTVVIHSALATTLYVDLNNQTGREDGSQARPYNTIQEAIDNASGGNTILVLLIIQDVFPVRFSFKQRDDKKASCGLTHKILLL